MNLVNQVVVHKAFGEGKVTAQDDSGRITVSFPQGEKKFVYPDAFKEHMKVPDEALQDAIQQELDAKSEKERLAWEEKQAAAEQKALEAQAAKKKPRSSAGRSAATGSGSAAKPRAQRTSMKVSVARESIAFKCGLPASGQTEDQAAQAGVGSEGPIHYRIAAKKGQPTKLSKVQKNSLCILTALDPGAEEAARYIFAVFLVDETKDSSDKEDGYVFSQNKYRLTMPPAQAHQIKFWNYYANGNSPEIAAWNAGPHRYLNDNQAVQILRDIEAVKQGTDDEALAHEFLEHYITVNRVNLDTVGEKQGALQR